MGQAARVLGVLLMLAIANVADGLLDRHQGGIWLPAAHALPAMEELRDLMEGVANELNRRLGGVNNAYKDWGSEFAPKDAVFTYTPVMTGASFDRATDTLHLRYRYPYLTKDELYTQFQDTHYMSMRYSLVSGTCAQQPQVFDAGIRTVHVFLDKNGQEIYNVLIDKAACHAKPVVPRAELQASLERAEQFINANTDKINKQTRKLAQSPIRVEIAGVVLENNLWVQVFRFVDVEDARPFTDTELDDLKRGSAPVTCVQWIPYLETDYTVVQVYLNNNDVILGRMLFDAPFYRPYIEMGRQSLQERIR